MVTDLDAHLVSRALVSLGAELKRREHLLAGPGAKDLEDYWALQRTRPELPAIPRLVLVIDEFAGLAAELPDFVQGLVGIAQRGRSLGIHLVWRPSGPAAWCPRRSAPTPTCGSRLGDRRERQPRRRGRPRRRPHPQGDPGPGLRPQRGLDPDAVPERPGRRTPPRRRHGGPGAPAPLAWPVPWSAVGRPAPVRPQERAEQTDEADTDLAALVDAIGTTSRALGVPAQHRPWLDALPAVVLREDLPPPAARHRDTAGASVEPAAAAWMLEDLPALQEQRSRTFTSAATATST